MGNGKIIIPSNTEKVSIEDLIFRSKDGLKELSFEEWFKEQNIDIILRKKRIHEQD